jgi:hypothetical protein
MKLNTSILEQKVVTAVSIIAGICGLPGALSGAETAKDTALSVAAEIRAEATRPNHDPAGRPLPLACSWTSGHYRADYMAGWRPRNQMRLVAEGHHLLPWFSHPTGAVPDDSEDFQLRYYKDAIAKARELKLPLTFIASQWESGLSGKPYVELPAEENPNVVTVEGEIQSKVSPFGPVAPWRQIGATFTDNPWMKQIQEWYPDPPLVIFLSNNEHHKLRWQEVETSKRYMDQYGAGRDDNFKRKVVGDGWIPRYRALQDGMRQALVSDAWRRNAIFIGYGVGDLAAFGRWGGWINYSLYSPGRGLAPLVRAWDGGSPSYYTHDWNPSSDYKVWGPQIQFMNNLLVQREALRLNPRFWYEFSVWDGYHSNAEREERYPAKRGVYRRAGQTYNPARYSGFVQFGMWLMRPRAVREFRGWTESWEDRIGEDGKVMHEGGRPYFMAIVEAVDRVHNNPTLREWWRHGELVPNPAREHPYQAGIPEEYRGEDRWFLLECDANPSADETLSLGTELPVFSLGLVRGEEPNRSWLVYAHSPVGDRSGVKVTVPGYREITIDSAVGGSFYTVEEKTGAIARIGKKR